MMSVTNANVDYFRPIKIAEGVFWVGINDEGAIRQANTFFIVDGDEAVVIDSGSRADFPSVIMKILQTGIPPSNIVALVYQNHDPRLAGSIPHFDSVIARRQLKIISDKANPMFIQHYSETALFLSLDDLQSRFQFSSGRTLLFLKTPYAHSAGSFVTLDSKTEILFTNDLFSSYPVNGAFFIDLASKCIPCADCDHPTCGLNGAPCPVYGILKWHRDVMPSERALKYAMELVAKVPFKIIAPFQGSIIYNPADIVSIMKRLSSLQGVGIDALIGDRPFSELGDVKPIIDRFFTDETQ